MKICKVMGFATASLKIEGLAPYKLLIVKGIDDEGEPTGETLLAVDTFGAGLSEVVAVVTGSTASKAIHNKDLPVDAAVVGIIDHVSINKKEIYSKNREE
ncbi:MAG: EutN/CcmL family microcompartment protein [Deltaproteobacteria bacterium]|nr:EutN/CcmL family microcompartment protein [Deltaproteobacteria bacterium]MBW2137481.1 EutN/CcmL family microcompartment protein [Deltaproteobacteria bacterium]